MGLLDVGFDSSSYEPPNLFAGDFPVATDEALCAVAIGQTVKRGTLLTDLGSGFGFAPSTVGQTPTAVCAEDFVGGGVGTPGMPVYLTGQFNPNALLAGDATPIGDFRDDARPYNIHIVKSVVDR